MGPDLEMCYSPICTGAEHRPITKTISGFTCASGNRLIPSVAWAPRQAVAHLRSLLLLRAKGEHNSGITDLCEREPLNAERGVGAPQAVVYTQQHQALSLPPVHIMPIRMAYTTRGGLTDTTEDTIPPRHTTGYQPVYSN